MMCAQTQAFVFKNYMNFFLNTFYFLFPKLTNMYCAMTSHFCVVVLFDYPCDMDQHESDAK